MDKFITAIDAITLRPTRPLDAFIERKYYCPDCPVDDNKVILCAKESNKVKPYFRHHFKNIKNPCRRYTSPPDQTIHDSAIDLLKFMLNEKDTIEIERKCADEILTCEKNENGIYVFNCCRKVFECEECLEYQEKEKKEDEKAQIRLHQIKLKHLERENKLKEIQELQKQEEERLDLIIAEENKIRKIQEKKLQEEDYKKWQEIYKLREKEWEEQEIKIKKERQEKYELQKNREQLFNEIKQNNCCEKCKKYINMQMLIVNCGYCHKTFERNNYELIVKI